MKGRFRIRRRDRDTSCAGTTKDGGQCGNGGKLGAGGKYWCHVHKVQELSEMIRQENRE